MPEDTSSNKIDEASDSLNTKKFYILLIFVALVGIIGALMMIVFMVLEDVLTATLWKDIPVDSLSPVFNPVILVICVAGGLGAGVIRHYFNGEIAIMAEDLIEFNEKGRFTLKRGLELFLRGLVSLVCGAPLGPEAPLTVATGAVGGSIAEKARMPSPVVTLSALSAISGFFGAFLTSPFARGPHLYRNYPGERTHDLEGGTSINRCGHGRICRLFHGFRFFHRRYVYPASLRGI